MPALAAAALTRDTKKAAHATRGAWHRAFEGAPATPGELRVARLAAELERRGERRRLIASHFVGPARASLVRVVALGERLLPHKVAVLVIGS